LLFAGSDTVTIINRIDLVLNRFGVTIDEGVVTQPMIDVATTAIDVDPTPVVVDQEVTVTVTVQNRGQLSVSNIDVTLNDVTGGIPVGANQITELRSGESATVGFLWIPTTDGSHTLVASLPENFVDEVEANNSISTTVEVTDQLTPRSVHIADLDGSSKNVKIWGIRMWKATVKIRVKNNMEDPVVGATVKGVFDDNPDPETGTFTCKTRSNGTCSLSGYQEMRDCLTFTVYDISHDLLYEPSDNNDPEGDSDGTNITVCRP